MSPGPSLLAKDPCPGGTGIVGVATSHLMFPRQYIDGFRFPCRTRWCDCIHINGDNLSTLSRVILTPKNDSQILHQRTDIDGGNFGKLYQRHVGPQ